MLVEPEESLSGTAEFQDFSEDQANGFLDAAVRVLLVTITGLHEADRRADDEFATARLLISGRERTLPQQTARQEQIRGLRRKPCKLG
jgi:hypothetical protein